jgi:diguanylate cyclase (GGDEF)-like protein/putative nucleotidyltransferase with HDIG domain
MERYVPGLPDDDGSTVERYTRDTGVMARSLAYIFAAGASISLLALAIPNRDQAHPGRVVLQAVCGYVLCAMLGIAGGRLPRWSFQVFLAAATLLIEWNIYASGDSTSPYAALYFWVSIYAFYFLSRREAVLQTGFIVVAYAALLMQAPAAGDGAVLRWAITMSALVFGGALIGTLQERIATLARATRTDPDTGLLNRSGLREALDAEIDRGRRSHQSLALVLVRIDGHRPLSSGAGNRNVVLELVTLALNRTKRGMDHAARLGERELALVVPECAATDAYMVAERVRSAAHRELRGLPSSITVSLGVACYPEHGATAESVLHAASQGVAAAEQLGRDRTVIYSPEIASLVLAAETRSHQEDRGSTLAAVLALTEVLDIRDAGTSAHSQTVGRYAEQIARGLGLSEELVERVKMAGILHDVGKIAVPDAVLSKPGPLDDDEFAQMKKHPEVGALIVDGADMKDVASWVIAHHERPDGRGYPRGLVGEEIPLEARILAVADAYEAMTVDRVYRAALPVEKARGELRRCSGSQFDPRVVEVFLDALERDDDRLGIDDFVVAPAADS